MKTLKIVGLVALIIWIGWISKEVMDTKAIAIETCGLVASRMGADGGIHLPVTCPDLSKDEVKST